jgi:hypothetical protein
MQSSIVSVRKNWLFVKILAGSWLSKLAPGDFSGSYSLGARAAPDLTPPHLCACPKPGFPTSYVVVFFVFSEFCEYER